MLDSHIPLLQCQVADLIENVNNLNYEQNINDLTRNDVNIQFFDNTRNDDSVQIFNNGPFLFHFTLDTKILKTTFFLTETKLTIIINQPMFNTRRIRIKTTFIYIYIYNHSISPNSLFDKL